MILTVTLNPLLERRFSFNSIKLYCENRGSKEEIKAGGKGINVSRQLNCMNIENFAFTFLGGSNGKLFKEVLINEKIKFSSVRIESETREAAVIIDNSAKRITSFFGPNFSVNRTEADEFKNKLEKMIENCEMVIFSGSSPCEETNSIIPFGIELANKHDKISICDTYGEHLKECINKAPTIIHNNLSEIRNSLGLELKSDKEKFNFLDSMYENGIKQVFLTDGGSASFVSNFDFHFKIENPPVEAIDATGSGDSFVAGIAYGLHNSLTFEETITIAARLGALNAARLDVCSVAVDELNSFTGKVKIFPIGKKMKTLDVTPK